MVQHYAEAYLLMYYNATLQLSETAGVHCSHVHRTMSRDLP